MTLGEVLSGIEGFASPAYIMIPTGAEPTLEVEAKVVPIPDDDSDVGDSIPGFKAWSDVYTAKDVLETWSEWRDGRVPTPSEALEAVLYYETHDSYQLTDEMREQGLE